MFLKILETKEKSPLGNKRILALKVPDLKLCMV